MILDMKRERKQYFKPLGIREVKEGRKKVEAKRGNEKVLASIDSLKGDEYLVLPKGYKIIPKGYDAQLWSTKGRELNLNTSKITREEITSKKIGPGDFIKKAFSEVNIGDKYRGYGWWGIKLKKHKEVQLVDVKRGFELYAFCKITGEDKKIRGCHHEIDCIVPSRSMKIENRHFQLVGLPTLDMKNQTFYADWLELGSNCTCEDSRYFGDVNHKYVGYETKFCPHAIAAYIEALNSFHLCDPGNPRVIGNPFPPPSKVMIDIIDKMENQVLIKAKSGHRKLDKAEEEVLCWKSLGLKGYDKMFETEGMSVEQYFKKNKNVLIKTV